MIPQVVEPVHPVDRFRVAGQCPDVASAVVAEQIRPVKPGYGVAPIYDTPDYRAAVAPVVDYYRLHICDGVTTAVVNRTFETLEDGPPVVFARTND